MAMPTIARAALEKKIHRLFGRRTALLPPFPRVVNKRQACSSDGKFTDEFVDCLAGICCPPSIKALHRLIAENIKDICTETEPDMACYPMTQRPVFPGVLVCVGYSFNPMFTSKTYRGVVSIVSRRGIPTMLAPEQGTVAFWVPMKKSVPYNWFAESLYRTSNSPRGEASTSGCPSLGVWMLPAETPEGEELYAYLNQLVDTNTMFATYYKVLVDIVKKSSTVGQLVNTLPTITPMLPPVVARFIPKSGRSRGFVRLDAEKKVLAEKAMEQLLKLSLLEEAKGSQDAKLPGIFVVNS